ncbi:unnamed protein product [marine sediment metagenome]|uniref:Uncharacterized protein n=1 Tax=marine sediment metagenome TaxID=412755 RepID=X0YDA1_9ZZZZ
MNNRNNQKQIWSDENFKKKLEEIQARRLLNGNPVKNIAQLTKEILTCPSFNQIEEELINFEKVLVIKVDKKRGLK